MPLASATLLAAIAGDTQIVRWVVWVGLLVLTVALLFLLRTRWGQSRPLGKCIVLSLLAHLLVGIYATTVNIVTEGVGSPDGKGIQVALIDGTSGDGASRELAGTEPWDAASGVDPAAQVDSSAALAPRTTVATLPPTRELERQPSADLAPALPPAATAGAVHDTISLPADPGTKDVIARPATPAAVPIETPQAEKRVEVDPVPPPEPLAAVAADGGPGTKGGSTSAAAAGAQDSAAAKSDNVAENAPAGGGDAAPLKPVPPVMQQRVGDHLQAARGKGVTQDSEARVMAALRWLANNQSGGGRWDAKRLGAGGARAADNEDRHGAGANADSGITGLSLLAFLAAGHTHLSGPYQMTVRRGLTYLQTVQDADGCLGVSSNRYERMYCHAMATCALSEAFAMTGDDWLAPAVRKAIRYTILAQDRVAGGWRYHPGDPGDTSQLGWQVMSLKSAELAGVPIPAETRDGIRRFLNSVAAGRSGGLARYQPNRGTTSRSMTAEALACRQFMGLLPARDASDEAQQYVLEELPGVSRTNVYYWYYATLAMFQLQGEAWQRWNEALQKNLLATQRVDGELAGSWDPDPVWGGCGGRAYSTALSALCLEVYYRFLPLHIEAAGRPQRAK